MNVSATGCSPIRPKAFGQGSEDGQKYEQIISAANGMNDEFVAAGNDSKVKKPLAAMASVVLAGVVAFVSGKKIASITSQIFKSAPDKIQQGLHAVSGGMKKGAAKLKDINPEQKIIGKLKVGTMGTKLGGFVDSAENFASKVYKKLAYVGISADAAPADKAKKVMENLFGWVAVGTMLPTVCSKDVDKNGVKDILEKGPNAYTGTSARMDSAVDKANKVATFVKLLT